MARDHRLNLGRYITSPFETKVKLNFHQLFTAKPEVGDAPWVPSRLSSADLLNKLQTRKLKLNPNLNFVGNDSVEYQMFAGLGHFNRERDYDTNANMALITKAEAARVLLKDGLCVLLRRPLPWSLQVRERLLLL